ncbi:MAG TPA: UpxY family transcription antiterminator [Bacteroidales bacterium]|nr:UpxY family transcription antiterminator [Bacteroidales bacterium]
MANNHETKKWYAVYVRSRAEKKASEELSYQDIQHYLPLIKRLKQWSDRKKWVEEPLFRSYIFVYIEQKEYYKVLQIPYLVRYITFEGKAVPIPNQQIDAIRYFLEETEPEELESIEWTKGEFVEVISGELTGLTGELIEVNGKHRVKVQIDVIGKSIIIYIPKNKLRIADKY